jgi:uncharacterized protein YqhQ
MHIVAIAVLALVAGYGYTLIVPKLQAAIPASFPQGKIAQSFLTGAFILIVVFLASWIVGMFGLSRKAV